MTSRIIAIGFAMITAAGSAVLVAHQKQKKLACITLALASLALPALAQVTVGGTITFSCTYPFGDHSLGVLASSSDSISKNCEATCIAHDSEDDTGILNFSVHCEGLVPSGASGLLMCSRGGYQGGPLENAYVATDFGLTLCHNPVSGDN